MSDRGTPIWHKTTLPRRGVQRQVMGPGEGQRVVVVGGVDWTPAAEQMRENDAGGAISRQRRT
jgi:hypothetical protein